MKREQNYLHSLLTFMLSGCLQNFPFLEDINMTSSELFFAGDTSSWSQAIVDGEFGRYEIPLKFSIAQDGGIFSADSSNHSIFVLDQKWRKAETSFPLLKKF